MNPTPDNGTNQETGFCFHGSYERAVDAKGRFNLPFRFRRGGGAADDEQYVVTVGPDGSLSLFPREEWEKAFNRIRSRSSSAEWRARVRQISDNSAKLDPDAQGRVMIPASFLEQVGVGRRVKVVGMGHYMELWEPERFVQSQQTLAEPDSEFMDEFFS